MAGRFFTVCAKSKSHRKRKLKIRGPSWLFFYVWKTGSFALCVTLGLPHGRFLIWSVPKASLDSAHFIWTEDECFIVVTLLTGLVFPSWFPILLVWSAFWPLCLYAYSEHLSTCRSLTLFLCSLQDYWLSLLYKRLIGPKVLAVHVAGLQRKPRPGRVIRDKLRIYAHCTNHHK